MRTEDRADAVECPTREHLPGAFADLVLLSPDELDPGADYRDQTPPPKGIRYVFLNGLAVLKDGQLTPDRAGKPLRAYGHVKP